MTDAELVYVVDSCNQLLEVLGSLCLLEFLVLNNHVEQFTPTGVLHDKVKVLLSLNDLVDLNHVGMMELLKNFDLSAYPLNVLLVLNFRLLKDLDGNLAMAI